MTKSSRRLPTVLLTGFEPFGGDAVNPSWEAVRSLQGKRIAGHRIATACLPVEFGAALDRLDAALDAHHPRMVLCVGLAGGRAQVSLERIAINVDDARIPDNAGAQPVDAPVIADAPAAYFTDLPIKAMLAALRHAGIPAEVSQSAGTYVCNHVFFGLMHRLATQPDVRGGFLHVPWLPEQAAAHHDAPSLELEVLIQALRVAVAAALDTAADLPLESGALC